MRLSFSLPNDEHVEEAVTGLEAKFMRSQSCHAHVALHTQEHLPSCAQIMVNQMVNLDFLWMIGRDGMAGISLHKINGIGKSDSHDPE